MADLGQAYVQIVPSSEGIAGSIESVLDPEAKKAGKSAGKSVMTSLGGTMQQVGGTLTKTVTLPLVGIGAASIAAFNEVHTGLETIVTKTGASGDALESMEQIMKDIGRSVPTDFNTIGSAIGEVNTRFGVTGEELESLSSQFVKFAQLNGTDVSTSIDKVQSAMAAFGLDAKDTSAFLDTLNKAGQDTGVSVDQLADDMMRNATAMKQLGLNAADSANLFANLNKNGIDTSTVMTGLRKALANAAKDGNTFQEEIEVIGERIKNAQSSTIAYEEAIELFGTKAGPQLADAIREGRISFEELGAALSDNLGNIDATFEATLTPMDKFKTTLNTMKELGAEVGSRLLTSFQPVLEKVAAAIGKILDVWDSLSPKTQDAIVKIGLVVAAIGPALLVMGKLFTAFTTIKTAITGVSTVMTLFTGPVGIVIAAIGAAIAAGVLLYKNWDKICEWANKLKENIVQVWEGIKGKISETVDSIKEAISSKFEGIKNTISGAWENVSQFTSGVWSNIQNTIQQNGGGIQGVLATAMQAYQNIWSTGLSYLDQITGGRLSNVGSWFINTFQNIWNFISNIAQKIAGIFNFQWKLPNIQLPHFSIVWNDLGHGVKLPSISVQWYKSGGIFDSPSLIGVGEAGREAVVPLEGSAMRPFAQTIAEEMAGGHGRNEYQLLSQLYDLLGVWLPQMAQMQLVTDTGALVGELAAPMDRELAKLQNQRGRMR